MAHLQCDFFSDSLALSTSMTVILPQPTSAQIGMTGQAGDEPPPVLYLLHGLTDDHTIWGRRTSIERYVAELGLAVVMPAVQHSFYTDEHYGLAYWTFLSEELPTIVNRLFRVSAAPEDTFVAGLSMGGYGAWQWALRHPERFSAAASLSGAMDLPDLAGWPARTDDPRMFERLFPGGVVPESSNLFDLLTTAGPDRLPALWLGCGDEDAVYPHNVAIARAADEAGIPVTTSWVAGAGHTWDLWDRQISEVLDWLPLRGR